jgi:hypothetical protein
MTPISAPSSSTIAAISLSGGDDPAAVLSLLSDARSESRLKSLQSSIDSIAPRLSRLRSLATLLHDLGQCPAGSTGFKVLGDMAPNQALKSPSPTLAPSITDAANDLGFNLPTQDNLLEMTTTYDSSGKVLWSNAVFATPAQVADARASYKQTASGAVDEYTYNTKVNGSTQTTKVQIYNQQGIVIAKDSDLAKLQTQVNAQIDQVGAQLNGSFHQLDAILLADRDKSTLTREETRVIREVEKSVNAGKLKAMDALGGPGANV